MAVLIICTIRFRGIKLLTDNGPSVTPITCIMYMIRVFVGADFAAYFRLLYVEMLILHLDTDYLRAERTRKLLNVFLYQ